ncbi:MAG: DUF4347 domain-containing protein [Leptolyngbyaceae cyanobacterium SL_7_1]|nr:DUF4347 domain-containing protein [Leptolyngbyaceae cyanobacterium SL_7_1]
MISTSILFIDSTVNLYSTLLADVNSSTTEVIILEADKDGIEQITAALVERSKTNQVHILSHGSPGCIDLGNTQLSLETFDRYSPQLHHWFNTQNASLFLYGCNVAAGDAGAEFLQKLRHTTGANLAASTSLIGHTELGGNWTLDYTLGAIDPQIPIARQALLAYPGVLTTAPTIADTATQTRSIAEDSPLTITGLSIGDPDTGETQAVTLSVAQGVLTLASISGLTGLTGNGTSSLSFSGSVASVNAALNGMSYSPATNFSGDESLVVTVNDGDQNASLAVRSPSPQ